MEAKQLTDKVVKAAKPKGKRYLIRATNKNAGGLHLRVEPSGRKSFYVVLKFEGRARWKRLGVYPDMNLEAAKQEILRIRADVGEKKNPFDEVVDGGEMTLGQLWEDYLENKAKPKKKSWKIDECQYKKHLKKSKNRRLGNIHKTDVKRWADAIEKNGGPVARNRVLALLSSMWTWAQDERDLTLENPTKRVQRTDEQPRERYLLPAELRRLYEVIVSDKGQASDALLLLLLTGQRKGNICGLRWSEFDSKDAVLKIPKERMKSGKAHIVPLAAKALEILEKRKKAAGKGEVFVFPTKGKLEYLYDLRRPLERMLKAAEIEERVTPHDLRRTWATYCGETRNDPGPLLGHAPQGVTKKYYEQVPLAFKRDVMDATVKHIIDVATSTKPEEAEPPAAAESAEVVQFPQPQAR